MLPSSSLPASVVENRWAVRCASLASPTVVFAVFDAVFSAEDACLLTLRACWMAFCADFSDACMVPMASVASFRRSMMPLRSSVTPFCAPSTVRAAEDAAFLTCFATASEAAVTKVELICSSIVLAPVSVIFGAMGFCFSLT